ncbi:MAG TPA: sugar phosphate isomerase/epimerase, partial [Actinotalea sp.]|nr:sugar phosphate isomerase/epimerase [Actinotalea sp.]
MTRPEMSVQLYSLRSRLDEELDEVLGALAGIGLTAVEPFDLAGWAPRLAPLLAGHGLRAPTAHVSLVGVDVEPALAAAHLLGTRTVIEPFVPQERWTTRDDIAAIATAA